MNPNYRSNNTYKNSAFNALYDRPLQSTGIQPKLQPTLYRDKERQRQRQRQREKLFKQNTQLNALERKQPAKKTLINRNLNHVKLGYGKSDNCTKLLAAILPISSIIRTDSHQRLDRSSRTRKQGSRSHNRLLINKKMQINLQRPRERQGSSHTINCQTITVQDNVTVAREPPKPYAHRNLYDQVQIRHHQKTQMMVKSRIRIERNRDEPGTGHAKPEFWKYMKQSGKYSKEQVIEELECQENFSIPHKLSRVRIGTRKDIQVLPQIKLSPEEQIKKFEEAEADIQKKFDSDCFAELIKRELEYQYFPHFSNYLDLRQKHINWIKRAVLINWMMEFMVDYGGRRETLNIAVSIVDRYLCSIEHCPLNRLQLVGITSLYIASKLEQTNRPALSSFAESTSEVFTQQDIMDEEVNILVCLKYEINSPTLHLWCLRLTIQWDLYLKTTNDEFTQKFSELIHFKNSDEKSYYNYRWLVQLLDFAILDIHTLRYKNRALVASFIYLILGLRTEQFKQNDVISEFPSSSQYLVDKQVTLNDTFNKFLSFSFNILLCDLHPTIQYCASYFILPLTFELPQKVKEQGREIGYEDFCSYQTLNKHNIYCLQKRNRDFD